jgi:hypothetical protein
VSTIEQVENTVMAMLEESDTPFADIMSVIIVERWDARHGKFSAHVQMSFDDVCDVDAWLNYNIAHYKKLRPAMQDIQEIFPGIPFKWLVERLYQYF